MIRINGNEDYYRKHKFPCGELHILLNPNNKNTEPIEIIFEFESMEEITELQLLKHTLDLNRVESRLVMPYLPFSRQDRVNMKGECFSLKWFCKLVNDLNFLSVETYDCHSHVGIALLDRCINHSQYDCLFTCTPYGSYYVFSPDAGASKKSHEFSKDVQCLGVIQCEKKRDLKTGEITETVVHADSSIIEGHVCVIVDDICDGGRTFIEIAKVLKERGAKEIHLLVTHGFFTKGLGVFDGLIDKIFTHKGQVK